MTVCDLNSGTGRLLRATKKLKQQWTATQENWNDVTRKRFEETFLQPRAPEIQLAIAAIERFRDVMQEAEKDCSEPTTHE